MKLTETILLVTLCLAAGHVNAQQVFVISKKINKQLAAQQQDTLILQAEKAHIHIIGWTNDEVKVELKLESKHPKEDIAARDLKYHQYAISRKNKTILIKNYFHASENYYGIKSNLSATYTIYVPKGLTVDVNGSYGSLKAQHLDGLLQITGKFLDISLEKIQGRTMVHSEYGDIYGTSISSFQGVVEKSELFLQAVKDCDVTSKYGSIEIAPLTEESTTRINAQKTNVKFILPDAARFDYNLSTSFADIILPETYHLTLDKTQDGVISFKKLTGKKAFLFARTSYSSISVVEVSNKIN